MRNQESKTETLTPKFPPRKQKEESVTHVQFPAPTVQGTDNKSVKSLICSNALCRAARTMDEAICKRCTCCLCKKFDDGNKDPHLWLECSSESGQRESCGFSCHIECAFRHKKVGVVNLGQERELDGSYECAACGKVLEILECWKKLLTDAKETNHISILCLKLDLSFRLLKGTTRYKELHEIVEEAKSKLESEIGPLRARSGTKGRGSVSKLSIASYVRSLCSFAVEKADKWSANQKDGSIPEACVLKSATVVEPTYGSQIRDRGKAVAFAQGTGFSSAIDLNCIPDLNEDVVLPVDSSREEQNELTLALVADSAAPVISSGEEQNQHVLEIVRDADVVHESENVARRVAIEEVPDSESPTELARKRAAEGANNMFANWIASGILDGAGSLNRNYEYCVETISDLGKHGHLELEFSLELQRWFSFRATENQRRAVHAFIKSWVDRPSILAKQLIDSYSEINSNKRPKVGSCSKFSDK